MKELGWPELQAVTSDLRGITEPCACHGEPIPEVLNLERVEVPTPLRFYRSITGRVTGLLVVLYFLPILKSNSSCACIYVSACLCGME